MYSLFFIKGDFKPQLKKPPPPKVPIPTQNPNLICVPYIWTFWKMAQTPPPLTQGWGGGWEVQTIKLVKQCRKTTAKYCKKNYWEKALGNATAKPK